MKYRLFILSIFFSLKAFGNDCGLLLKALEIENENTENIYTPVFIHEFKTTKDKFEVFPTYIPGKDGKPFVLIFSGQNGYIIDIANNKTHLVETNGHDTVESYFTSSSGKAFVMWGNETHVLRVFKLEPNKEPLEIKVFNLNTPEFFKNYYDKVHHSNEVRDDSIERWVGHQFYEDIQGHIKAVLHFQTKAGIAHFVEYDLDTNTSTSFDAPTHGDVSRRFDVNRDGLVTTGIYKYKDSNHMNFGDARVVTILNVRNNTPIATLDISNQGRPFPYEDPSGGLYHYSDKRLSNVSTGEVTYFKAENLHEPTLFKAGNKQAGRIVATAVDFSQAVKKIVVSDPLLGEPLYHNLPKLAGSDPRLTPVVLPNGGYIIIISPSNWPSPGQIYIFFPQEGRIRNMTPHGASFFSLVGASAYDGKIEVVFTEGKTLQRIQILGPLPEKEKEETLLP